MCIRVMLHITTDRARNELHHVYLEGARGCATTFRNERVTTGRANVIGTGLIGGSIGLALRRLGCPGHGLGYGPGRAERALELGALDEIGLDPIG